MVVYGTEEQKKRWLPPLIAGNELACFGVTEPNVGLNILKLQTKATRVRNQMGGDYYPGPAVDIHKKGVAIRKDCHPLLL